MMILSLLTYNYFPDTVSFPCHGNTYNILITLENYRKIYVV